MQIQKLHSVHKWRKIGEIGKHDGGGSEKTEGAADDTSLSRSCDRTYKKYSVMTVKD